MTYTINGKPYTKFDINVKCAELSGSKSAKVHINCAHMPSLRDCVMTDFGVKDYCNKITDTEVIIDKCFHKLVEYDHHNDEIKWEALMDEHKCTKLVAACICYIEINEGKL